VTGRHLKVVDNWPSTPAGRIGHTGMARLSRRWDFAPHMIDQRCCKTVVERSHGARTEWSRCSAPHQSAAPFGDPKQQSHIGRQRKRRDFDMMGRSKCSGLVEALGHWARD
jgi:hypothetical protein